MLDIEKIRKEKPMAELLKFSIINLDKPSGPTSFQVSQYVKHLLGLNKTSHLGTLDPAVSGVLPVALSRACRLNDYLMHRDKEYVGIMRLHEDISESELNEKMSQFIGKITQLPPVRSRVKRAERIREVMEFRVLEKEGKDVLFFSKVQAGTYIRKLIHDLGEQIGGAHMLELRRTKAAIFEESSSIDLYRLDQAVKEYQSGNETPLREILIPGEIVSSVLSVVNIKPEAVKKILSGSPIFKRFIEREVQLSKDEKICAFSQESFLGCFRVVDEGEILAVPEFVFN